MNGTWDGEWNADKSAFRGTYTFPDGRTFKGSADWVTKRVLGLIDGTGRVVETTTEPVTPHWQYTGTWVRKDGRGASAPHEPEPPEERDNGEPPPEEE